MMVCCTQGALCSSNRRSRWDLPEPELPCTSRRVASSSSRSRTAAAPAVVCPISIATVMPRLKVSLLGGAAYQYDHNPSSAHGRQPPCSACCANAHRSFKARERRGLLPRAPLSLTGDYRRLEALASKSQAALGQIVAACRGSGLHRPQVLGYAIPSIDALPRLERPDMRLQWSV